MIPRRVSLLMLAVLLLGALSTGRAFGQAEPQPTRELQAVFSRTTPGGIVTDVFVEVTDGPDGAEAVIEVSRYRSTCANNGCPQVLQHAFNRVPLAADALQVTGALETVTVRGSGPAHQPLVPGVGTVALDMTWTGAGRSPVTSMRKGNAPGTPRLPVPCARARPTSPPRSPSTPPSRSGEYLGARKLVVCASPFKDARVRSASNIGNRELPYLSPGSGTHRNRGRPSTVSANGIRTFVRCCAAMQLVVCASPFRRMPRPARV